MKLNIKQHSGQLTKAVVNKTTNLLIVLPDVGHKQKLPTFPYSDLIKQRLDRNQGNNHTATPWTTDLPNDTNTHVSVISIPDEITPFELLSLARQLVSPQLKQNPRSLTCFAPGFSAKRTADIAEAVSSATLAGIATMPSYKSIKSADKRLTSLVLYGMKNRIDNKRILAEAEGNALARGLTMLPPNELTPTLYRRRVSKLAKENGWKMEFLDEKTLKRKKAGSFLAVSQGSADRDAGIVHLRYQPVRATKKPALDKHTLALIGKGICFDTGGTNLKPAKHMHGMHEDMQGSAVALGTFLALTKLKVPFPVHCWLALAQNHIGPRAYKQNDVVTACNGTTIEIMHTDAEGRMVLADTLAFASRSKPALMIDYATLTGACVYSLSSRYSGVFTNRDYLNQALIDAGRESGERVWPFPVDKDYDKELDSQIADIKQCSLGGEADHILATRFLSRFVNDRAWVHVDLSAGNNKGGLAHIPTDVTGFGVRFTLNFLLDKKALEINE